MITRARRQRPRSLREELADRAAILIVPTAVLVGLRIHDLFHPVLVLVPGVQR